MPDEGQDGIYADRVKPDRCLHQSATGSNTASSAANRASSSVRSVAAYRLPVGLETLSQEQMKAHFQGQLAAPEEPTHVCIMLSNGLTYYGPITQGEANPDGGWLAFECDMPGPELLG